MKTLYDETITIKKMQSKTNIKVPFNVDKNYDKLIIEYSYSPKHTHDEDICKPAILKAFDEYEILNKNWQEFYPIGNLITVSLDDENGEYLGCAHNQKPQNTYEIAKDKSSYGFYPKQITKGTYCVVLNVHLVFHEDVKYHLHICAQ